MSARRSVLMLLGAGLVATVLALPTPAVADEIPVQTLTWQTTDTGVDQASVPVETVQWGRWGRRGGFGLSLGFGRPYYGGYGYGRYGGYGSFYRPYYGGYGYGRGLSFGLSFYRPRYYSSYYSYPRYYGGYGGYGYVPSYGSYGGYGYGSYGVGYGGYGYGGYGGYGYCH